MQSFRARWFFRRKEARIGTASGRTGLRSIFSGEPAISVRAVCTHTHQTLTAPAQQYPTLHFDMEAEKRQASFETQLVCGRGLPFTVVSLVISFLRRSKKISSVPGSSAGRWSPVPEKRKTLNRGKLCDIKSCDWEVCALPRLQMICPIQEMARSFTSWSMSAAFRRLMVQVNRSLM